MLDLSAVAPTSGGTDKTITLRARADASVAELKGQLAAKCGLAAADLLLMSGSKPLWRDGYTLGDYGLRAGAMLVATGRVRGGMDGTTTALAGLHVGLARGAAPAIEGLGLDGNPASDAAQQAVHDALKNRK